MPRGSALTVLSQRAATNFLVRENRLETQRTWKIHILTGVAAPLDITNVDTDMIIPKQYLKTIKRTGLGSGLFAELRYKEDGTESPFWLNKPALSRSQNLSRKIISAAAHASMLPALLDFESAASSRRVLPIFSITTLQERYSSGHCFRQDLAKLMDDAKRGANATLSIDLEAQEIRGPDGGVVTFDIDPFRKHCLSNGLDDTGLILQKAAKSKLRRPRRRRMRLALTR
jgi:3-isopropylmalate/(R)-2-methylmalate dehydratase small subunit